MIYNAPHIYTALVTIECATPMSIKGDETDISIDTRLVRDANGFPTIPGTSIAGVLRKIAKKDGQDTLFGDTHAATKEHNHPSTINISFGYCHNSQNQPLIGIQAKPESKVDNLLLNLMPIMRDQVALNEYGTAIDKAKLDRTAVPKGTRFSFELTWSAQQPDEQTWHNILSWFEQPDFRLGGLSQRGFGKVNIQKILTEKYDLSDSESLKKWQYNRSSSQRLPFKASNGKDQPAKRTNLENEQDIHFSITLEAEDFWRIGQGSQALGTLGEDFDSDPKIKPYSETIISWQNDSAELKEKQIVIPATGIKGALRHRTLFHLRRLTNDFSDGVLTAPKTSNSDLKTLFGDSSDQGLVGSVQFDDIYDITGVQHHGKYITKVMMHNKIDRFTGGTIDGALFSEELIYGGTFTLKGRIINREASHFTKTKATLSAFKNALEDLANGNLAIGGGSTKGHGYFNATSRDLSQLEKAIHSAPERALETH